MLGSRQYRQAQEISEAVVCPVHGTILQPRWITFLSHGNLRSVSGLRCAIEACGIWFDASARGGFFFAEADGERKRVPTVTTTAHSALITDEQKLLEQFPNSGDF